MISPSEVERLQDILERYRTMIIVGVAFMLFGAPIGLFSLQDPANGQSFMLKLMAAEETVAVILIIWGYVKVRALKRLLQSHEPQPPVRAHSATA